MKSKPNRPLLPAPAWPPGPTLWQRSLEVCFWYRTSKEEWSKLDWELYALNMEERGTELVKRLEAAERELLGCRAKLARKPMEKGRLASELSTYKAGGAIFYSASPTRNAKRGGRPREDADWERASEAYALRLEMEATSGAKVTNDVALGAWYARHGQRSNRALKDRAALTRMAKIHTKTTLKLRST